MVKLLADSLRVHAQQHGDFVDVQNVRQVVPVNFIEPFCHSYRQPRKRPRLFCLTRLLRAGNYKRVALCWLEKRYR